MTTDEENRQTRKQVKDEWLALNHTPDWAKPLIEKLDHATVLDLVYLTAELSFAIRLCSGDGPDRLVRFATDLESPVWMRKSLKAYLATPSRWDSNRHIRDLQTLLELVNALLEIED